MVATLAQAASAAYYLESQRSFRHPNEYYTAGEEPDGVWFNPQDLFGLADGGKVDSSDFHRLYHGFAPNCQRRSKSTPLAGVKMHHLMRFSPALAVVPVVHRRDPRCFV